MTWSDCGPPPSVVEAPFVLASDGEDEPHAAKTGTRVSSTMPDQRLTVTRIPRYEQGEPRVELPPPPRHQKAVEGSSRFLRCPRSPRLGANLRQNWGEALDD